MKKQFVTYNIALALKELGFDEECLACYYPWSKEEQEFQFIDKSSSNSKCGFNKHFIDSGAIRGCSAPLWQQVIDWFRVEHDIILQIGRSKASGWWYFNENITNTDCLNNGPSNSYDECRESAILKAIEIIKNITIK